MMRPPPGCLLLLIGAMAAAAAAEDPLMTDIRLLVGTASRDATGDGDDMRFDRSFEVAAQFLWSRYELVPSGSWFLGAQGSFADRSGAANRFALSTLTLHGLAGYAVAPAAIPGLHVELGLLAGLGGAIARTAVSDDLAPWLEGGLRAAAVMTWEQLQAGVEIGYRLGITHVDPGTGSSDYLIARGAVVALSLGMRIE